MNAVYAILKRELKSYFASPLAYVILVVFQLVSAVFQRDEHSFVIHYSTYNHEASR